MWVSEIYLNEANGMALRHCSLRHHGVLADGLPTSWSPTSPRSPGLLSQIPNDEHNWAYDKGRVQRRTAALELYGTMLLFSLLVDFQQGLTPQQLHNPPYGVGMPPTAATGADMGATHKCATINIHTHI